MIACTQCGRVFRSITISPLHCPCGHVQPFDGVRSTAATRPTASLRDAAKDRHAICRLNQCGHYGDHPCTDGIVRTGCDLVKIGGRPMPCRTFDHLLAGGACPDDPQHFGPAFVPVELPEELRDSFAVVTFAFNFAGFTRPAEVYRQWRPSLGDVALTCLEVVIDDAEPEIDGSTVIRGGPEHVLWQKERLVNLAVSRLPPSVRYVAWVDHDTLFDRPDWITRSVELLDRGVAAVQPLSSIQYLDREGRFAERSEPAAVTAARGHRAKTGPGMAWVARRDTFERIGGLYDRNVVGGGDAVWFSAVSGQRSEFLDRQSPPSREDSLRWIDHAQPHLSFGHVDGRCRHIWHGDRRNRQYITRDAILRRHDFDPRTDVEIDADNGLLRWTGTKPDLADEVRDYFTARREDG